MIEQSRLIEYCRTRHFNLVTFWSSTLGGPRRSSMETWAVNQNRNARWADPEERLFGLTLDLGQGARLTPAGVTEGRETGNSTANQILSLFLLVAVSLSLRPDWPELKPTIMLGHSFSRHTPVFREWFIGGPMFNRLLAPTVPSRAAKINICPEHSTCLHEGKLFRVLCEPRDS